MGRSGDESAGPRSIRQNRRVAEAVILSAVRTPVGRYGGALAGMRPDDLAALVIEAAVERAARHGEAGASLPARQRHGLGHDARVALPERADGGDVPARVDGRDG